MEWKTTYLTTSKTARIASYGELNENTKYFWFTLHGSHMTCEQMIYKFEGWDPKTHYVVSPEGLNRMYLNGFGGDVVASWMTSRDRLHEIEDFSEYLTHLFLGQAQNLPEGCKRNILGFSQGGTTVFRWLHRREISYDHLINYTGWIPEDIDLKTSKSKLSPLIYTYGTEDEFLTEDRFEFMKQVIERNELDVEFEPYQGKHKVDKKQLKYLFEKYIEL